MAKFHYLVGIKDTTISRQFVQKALDAIYNPGVWNFQIVDISQVPYRSTPDASYGEILLPENTRSILIADSRMHPSAKYAGLCACEGHRDFCKRCTAFVYPDENGVNVAALAQRIHHEVLHGHGAPADGMCKSPQFDQWLPESIRGEFVANKATYEHSLFYQQYYNRFLTDTVVVPQLASEPEPDPDPEPIPTPDPDPDPTPSVPSSFTLTNEQKIALAAVVVAFVAIFIM